MKPCWGYEDLRVMMQDTLGIIKVTLINLTSKPLYHVQFVPLVDPEFKLISSHNPIDLKPFESRNIHLVYTSEKNRIGSVSIHFLDSENAYLMNIVEDIHFFKTRHPDLQDIQTWATSLRDFHQYRRKVDLTVAPHELVNKFQEKFGFRFESIETNSSTDLIWVAFNPPTLLNLSGNLLKIFTDDSEILAETDKNITRWCQELTRNETVKAYFEIGKLVVTLQDYIDLGWYIGDVELALDKLNAYLTGLKIPSPMGPFKNIISNKNNLSELDDRERVICLQTLKNLERNVIPII